MKTSNATKTFVGATVVTLLSAAAIIIPTTRVDAWSVDQAATSACQDNTAFVSWSFKNTEPNQPKWSIDLEVTDAQTGGKTVKTVTPGQSVSGTFSSSKSKLTNGKVSFKMLWTDGRGGVDTRTSNYQATPECYVTPEQPAFNANVICTIVDDATVFTLRINQTAGAVDGVFSPANGDIVTNGESVEVLGIFNTLNTSEKIVVTTEKIADCTPEAEEKEIKVCRDDKIITILESKKLSSDKDICPTKQVENPTVLAAVTELPKTGASSIVAVLGTTFAAGTSLSHIVQKRRK